MIFLKVMNFMVLNNIVVLAMNLPKIDFIHAFAKNHNRDSIIIHSPDNLSNELSKWHKTYRLKHQMLPMAYIFTNLKSNMTQLQANAKDLHVYIPDNRNLDGSISHFIHLFSHRTRDNP